jgi:hypothetical protein
LEEKVEEKHFDKVVSLTHSNAKQFFDALTNVVEINYDILLHFLVNSFEIRTLDSSEISMVHAVFNVNYESPKSDFVVSVSSEALRRIIALGKRSTKPTTLELFTKDNEAKIKVIGEAFETEIEGSLLGTTIPLPKVSFSNSFALTKKELSNVFKVNGEHVVISYNEKGVNFVVSNDAEKYTLYPSLITSDITKSAKVKVDMKELKRLVKHVKSNQHIIFFYEGYEKPIKILVHFLDGTEINYYLAPIVEE